MSGGPLSDEDRLDWLILSKSENVGPTTFRTLIKRFHTADAALRALPELTRKGGLRRPPRIFSRGDAERAIQDAVVAYGQRLSDAYRAYVDAATTAADSNASAAFAAAGEAFRAALAGFDRSTG